jgi:hypothetical protein
MDRATKPYNEVKEMLGAASCEWEKLVGYIRFNYVMDEDWREGKPTHKGYNNLFIRRSGKSLIMLALREGYFQAAFALGKKEREEFEKEREAFQEIVCKEYDEAEIYHDGKWIGFDIYDEALIEDIIRLLNVKRKPNRKIFPDSLEGCGRLDLGLSHEEITDKVIT